MSRFIERSLLVCSLLLALSACQSTVNHADQQPVIDEFAIAEQVFVTHLDAQQLQQAAQQLAELQRNHADEPRIADLQQRLADAWLASGEQALQDGDIDAASAALIQAKRLLPQAPALTEGLSSAIAAAQLPVLEPEPVPPAVTRPRPARPKTAPVKPALTEPAPTVDSAEVEPLAPDEPEEVPAPKRSKIKARVIDASAEFSVVPLPMLKNRNDHQLGRLLDDVAVDVVRFRAAVTIEVADTLDFHWVAALLSARVKKLDANFKPRLHEVIRSEEPARLVITPNKSL